MTVVPENRVWTAAELERLTPEDRHRVVTEGMVSDLDEVTPEFMARVRAKGRALLEERGLLEQPTDGG